MQRYLILLVAFALLAASAAIEFNYENQTDWPELEGACFCGGYRQSPINNAKKDVEENSDLIELVLTNWGERVDGTFDNNGHSVQFNPSTILRGHHHMEATTQNHLGTYVVQQFHFHWGENNDEGSEHRINSNQYAAEIHFVHLRQNAETGDIDRFSVVGVFCEADEDADITGIWEQLMVPTKNGGSNRVTDVRYTDLLPEDLDYYYYEGSLTTPPCSQQVQWFVLKRPISIPAAYLQTLRQVEENECGTLLTHNFRNPQSLNRRTVQTLTHRRLQSHLLQECPSEQGQCNKQGHH